MLNNNKNNNNNNNSNNNNNNNNNNIQTVVLWSSKFSLNKYLGVQGPGD